MAEGGGQRAVAVLGEPHFQCHIQRQGVLILCKALGDADRGMNRLVCTGVRGLGGCGEGEGLQQMNAGTKRL